MEKLFPTIGIIVNIGAVIFYATQKDWKHAGYWLAAAFLTFDVTFLMK